MRFRSLCRLSCAAAALLVSCHDSSSRPPNVLLVVVDTLRADRLGAYGDSRGLTPFLDELAARGTVFRNAYAASSWTPPSVASLFTSRFPSQHRVSRGDSKLGEEEVTLAERLADRGYATAGFSANLRLTDKLGFAQGFQHWVSHPNDPGIVKPRGRELRVESLEWIDRTCIAPGSPPCFLYLQYMEPHAPYQPPEPFRSRYGLDPANNAAEIEAANRKLLRFPLSELSETEIKLLQSYYDGEVAAVDAELRLLFEELRKRRFLDDAIVVITADHGEEFGDHDWVSHGTSLYNEVIRVPLIVLGTGIPKAQVVEENTSLVDVAPTLLDLTGAPPEESYEGRSLVDLLRRGSVASRMRSWLAGADEIRQPIDIVAELERSGTSIDLRRHMAGIVQGDKKLLLTPSGRTTETYDLNLDPRELDPLPRTGGTAVPELARSLAGYRKELKARARGATERRPLDEATKEKLRALGYQP